MYGEEDVHVCDWEMEVKMLASEIADRQTELDAYKEDLEYALIMRDNAMEGPS